MLRNGNWTISHMTKNTVIYMIDKDTVQETGDLTVILNNNILDYTAKIYGTIVRDSNGNWHFSQRFFVVQPGFTLASYGR